MLSAVLIDDEKHCNETLAIELSRHCRDIRIAGQFTSGKEGIDGIRKLKPDIVFLDIEMPWMNGFEVLQSLGTIEFDVIFITAYDNYALNAFRYSAVDYLLKPIKSDLLIEAVDKVRRKANHSIPTSQFEALIHNLKNGSSLTKIVFPTGDGLEVIEVANIIRCQADNNYSHIFLQGNNKLLLSRSLKDVESMLHGAEFLRVHQSHLINLNHIKKYIKSDGGYLLMSDGSEISVSKSRKEMLLQFLQGFSR